MRLYINRFDAEHIWSVDDGDISTETQWDAVSVLCPSFTNLDLTKRGSKTEPCCWIEAQGRLRETSIKGMRMAVIE